MLFFPLGVVVNALSVFVGGAVGAMLGEKIPERLRINLTLIFGICSCSMGISTIVKMQTLPALVFAIIIGTAIGELIYLEKGIAWGARKFEKPIAAVFPNKSLVGADEYMEKLIGIIVLFVASGTGIFGALQSGLTGDHTILITKSILDLFTAAIFAASLGYIVSVVAIPQFIVLFLLFLSAALIMPLTNASMLADFSACGGVLMFATGLRICGIKVFPIGNMLPAMLLIMPFSYLWTTYIIPLLKSMM
ncbi:MAG: DUF554 domain-containing protein [Negativicutes bacterium]|nr:DUF554 domain-containing protein [Negativicutes bacterium]